MNTDNFLIEEKDIEFAQSTCKIIENSDIRSRAVANVIAANIAEKFFDNELYKIDVASGLHNISDVLEKIDISDIYINNSYIETRIYFNDEELSIPRYNFDNKLLPIAYMFIKVTPDLSGASVTGFILPENIDLTNCSKDYYIINENDLLSFYDIEPCLTTLEDTYSVEERQIFEYLDNHLEDNNQFYRALLQSESARLKLAQAAKARYIFNFVSVAEQEVNSSVDASPENPLPDSLPLFSLESEENDFELMDAFSKNDEGLHEAENVDMSVLELENLNELESFNDFNVEGDVLELAEDSFLDVLQEDAADTLDLVNANEDADEEEPNVPDTFEFDEEITSTFDFSTMTSPSLDALENNDIIVEDADVDNYDENLLNDLNTNIEEDVIDEEGASNEIENLFNKEDAKDNENGEEELSVIDSSSKKSGSSLKLILVVGLVLLIGAGGYLGYTKFAQNSAEEDVPVSITGNSSKEEAGIPLQDSMPIETVESTMPNKIEDEGTAVAIPAIEQNLDASILVSNLKVLWEVPKGYTNNTSVKRYFEKAGKIIQLNLKTELLLLSKPPITNKITVEIKFNDSTKKFETVGIKTSSGEKTVDDLILQTINKALAMNLSVNTDSFGKLQGNPVLIIQL